MKNSRNGDSSMRPGSLGAGVGKKELSTAHIEVVNEFRNLLEHALKPVGRIANDQALE